MLAAQGNTVVVFSEKTGELVSKFEPTRETIISIQFDIYNKDFLIGCTESGQLVKWKSKKGTIEQRIELQLPKSSKVTAFSLVSVKKDESNVQAIVVYKTKARKQTLDLFDVKTGVKGTSHFNYDLSMAKVIITASHNLNVFALAQQSYIYVVDMINWKTNRLKNAAKQRVTCLEFHPEQKMLATGDVQGKIFTWRNLFQDFPLTSLYHWHHTQVNSLQFTESGTSLYSCGNEAVLVRWGVTSREKSFLPRLPSNGVQMAISPNNAKFAVSLDDNSIMILGDNQTVETTLQLFSYIPQNKTNLPNFPIGFKLNPRNQSVLYNGKKGQIQFFSTYTKSLIYNVSNFSLA